uniref:Uncharacterized protein n=1 Tax=Rhizophora mucronata TaxID=61149 RepID=A0A2P2Q8P1_RHIMU
MEMFKGTSCYFKFLHEESLKRFLISNFQKVFLNPPVSFAQKIIQ